MTPMKAGALGYHDLTKDGAAGVESSLLRPRLPTNSS